MGVSNKNSGSGSEESIPLLFGGSSAFFFFVSSFLKLALFEKILYNCLKLIMFFLRIENEFKSNH